MNRPLALGAALAVLSGAALTAAVGAGAASATNASAPGASDSSCLWFGPTFTADDTELNYAFPDSGALYWAAHFSIPDGAKLTLEGEFAHARYQSLNSYNTANYTPIDALNDVNTAPDAGSRNPYLPGARRAGDAHRSYEVAVTDAPAPAPGSPRPQNTLYAGAQGQETQLLIYRLYLPDNGRDVTGGAGLPEPRLTLADGTELAGDAACAAIESTLKTPVLSTVPRATYDALRNQPGKPATFPAEETVVWRAYYNSQFTFACAYRGACGGNPVRVGGQYSNIDNNYVSAYINRGFGKVLTLRGKLPVTPQTLKRRPFMDARVDMRYWSLCSNESSATTRVEACAYDEQVPTDRNGNYTIVVSRAEDRPANARPACGVAWIAWPENGDGAGHLDDGFLIMRNMMPSAGFGHAVQKTTTPGDEKQVMGDYLPGSDYSSVSEFEGTGCQA